MEYVTTGPKRDLQDKEYYYRKGDTFPREGLEVSHERLDELLEGGHIAPKEVQKVLTDLPEDLNDLKKDELIALAKQQNVEVNTSDTKAEIIEKLGE